MPTCLDFLKIHTVVVVSMLLLLCVDDSDGTVLRSRKASFLDPENTDDNGLSLVDPLNLALFNDFTTAADTTSDSSIYSRLHIADTARCFSCMSRLYEAVWPALSSIYKRPKNFTDRCNDEDLDPRYVPFTYCPTICLQMWEEPTVAGVRIKGHIRGCLDELLYNGFNQTIVAWYRWMHRDSCRQYRKRELFKLPAQLSDDSYITVCTCYADYCNGKSSGGMPRRASQCSLFLVLLCSIFVLLPIQRISSSLSS